MLTGQVIGSCLPQRRTKEFLSFMDATVARYPDEQEIHVILDNLSTHAEDEVTDWLTQHPNV